jgi:hypothetical protein
MLWTFSAQPRKALLGIGIFRNPEARKPAFYEIQATRKLGFHEIQPSGGFVMGSLRYSEAF